MSSSDAGISPRQLARSGLCVGCGACVTTGAGLEMRLDAFGQFKPRGPGATRGSEALARTCPFSPAARQEDRIAARLFPQSPHVDGRIGRYEAAYVGYAAEPGFREAGSSGGLTSWLACELLRLGLVDGIVHVAPGEPGRGEPLFGFRISRTVDEVRRRAKSRYFPVELSSVLDEMRRVPGRYAVVGIPCFIKAIRLLCDTDATIGARVAYTLGLFCGHMKSARLAESFAWQLGAGIAEVQGLDFRRKDAARPANWYRAEITLRDGSTRAEDWFHLVDGDWGAGFFQNDACNWCDDVVAETADVSFGDAWAPPYDADGRGTNVVVVRDRRLHGILRAATADRRVSLEAVDADFVVRTQAAGFRQRREGLAYRLAHHRGSPAPVKRVVAGAGGLTARRRAIYAMRRQISRWSHRVFWLARALGAPALYRHWAAAALHVYQALAYSRGKLGSRIDGALAVFGRHDAKREPD